MGNSSKRDARTVKIRERQARALRLRLAGASYDAIAREVGFADRSNARRDVMAAIEEIIREPAEEVRAMELARLDAMLLGLWPKASKGDAVAVAHVLRIQDRRASYLGLDASKRLEISNIDVSKLPDDELRRIARGEPPSEGSGGT